MSAIVSIDSSSDEEILFFPVTKPKQDNSDDDDEVIFCGTNITPKNDSEFRPISYLKGRDVTIQSIGKKKPSASSNSDHDDVEFLGYVSKDVDESCSLTKVRKTPRSRPQSNVNININSEKSTNNLISIDIEDADRNQKKVKLTFLGPSRRQSYNSLSSNNLNTSVLNPKSTSSPKKHNNNVLKNQGSIAPRALKKVDISSRIDPRSSVDVNQQSKSLLNRADNSRNFKTFFPAKTVIHNFKIPKIGEKNVSKFQTGYKVDSLGRVMNKAVLNESSQEALNRLKNKLNQNVIQFNQNDMTSKISNSTVKENKIISENKSPNKATEKSIKKPESSSLNNKNLTVENQNKTTEIAEATRKHEIVKPESKSSSSLDKNTNLKKNKQSPTTVESKTEKAARKKSAVKSKSPEPSTSGIGSKQAYQHSESESEDSRYDSASDVEENKSSMKKSDLDKLFSQFLDHCTENYSKQEVSVLTSKLRKLYKKTTKAEENEDFIITLKEANLKVENKSIRCPLSRMKQVQAQLRKNSPDNIHKIKKLENVLEQINKRIKKIEEAEITSDEEECNNNYVTLERYHKRAVTIYEKICELSSLPADAERATLRNVSFQGSAPSEFSKSKSIQGLVNKVSHALEKYYNKSRKFPDFNDVNLLMNKLSVELSIKIKPTTLKQLARSIFVEFGSMLQRRRLHDDYRICMEYLGSDEEDPYHYDPILAAKLDENRKRRKKEQHVLDKFCLKQIAMKEKDFQDSSESFGSSSSESETDRRRKKSKKHHNKSENEDSDCDRNYTGDKCDDTNDSLSDSSYSKKKSSKTIRKRTRTSSESLSDSSSSSMKNDRNKRHKSKKKINKLVRDESQDNLSNNNSESKKTDKPEKCLDKVLDTKLLSNKAISENDAPLTPSESVKEMEITENQTVLCETELIENENVGEIGRTETENVKEVETIEKQCVEEIETFEIESGEEMEVGTIESVKEVGTIESVKEVGTIEVENVVVMVETTEDDSIKDRETVENASVKEIETVKKADLIEGESVKLTDTVEDNSVKETETTENASDKEIETTINVTPIENNKGNDFSNQDGDDLKSDNDNHLECADTNTADVTEETKNETEDRGTLSIQIVNVETCSQPFSVSQDEDTCESESNDNQVKLAVTGITNTIELSDDEEDCVLVSEEKKTVLTDEEVMELIPLIFDKKFK